MEGKDELGPDGHGYWDADWLLKIQHGSEYGPSDAMILALRDTAAPYSANDIDYREGFNGRLAEDELEKKVAAEANEILRAVKRRKNERADSL